MCGILRLLGIVNLLTEMRGEKAVLAVHEVDPSACKGILLRKGVGSIKHLETKDLWVQEVIRRRSFSVRKIPRAENASDSMASYSAPSVLQQHMQMLNCSVMDSMGLSM